MPLRRTHSDRRLHQLLHAWGVIHSTPAAIAARRAFRDYGEFQEFFRLALPGSGPVTSSAVIEWATKKGPREVSAVSVLESLAVMQVERNQLAPAAYLLELDIRLETQSGSSFVRRETPTAQEFIRAFASEDISILRENLPMVDWMELGLCRWLLGCRAAGMPRDYMQALVFALRVEIGYAEETDWEGVPPLWPPEMLHSLYADGLDVQTIKKFWNQPEVLLAARADNLPWEYIDALADAHR